MLPLINAAKEARQMALINAEEGHVGYVAPPPAAVHSFPAKKSFAAKDQNLQ